MMCPIPATSREACTGRDPTSAPVPSVVPGNVAGTNLGDEGGTVQEAPCLPPRCSRATLPGHPTGRARPVLHSGHLARPSPFFCSDGGGKWGRMQPNPPVRGRPPRRPPRNPRFHRSGGGQMLHRRHLASRRVAFGSPCPAIPPVVHAPLLSDNYNCPSTTTRNAHPDERSLTAAGSRPRNVPGPEAEVVTDAQVRKLMSERDKGATVEVAALKAGVCRRTATKYLSSGKLPSVLPSTRGTVAPRTLLTVRSVPVDLLRAERERPGRRASGSDGRKPAVGRRMYPASRSGHRCARGGRCA